MSIIMKFANGKLQYFGENFSTLLSLFTHWNVPTFMNGWSRKVKVQLFEPPWTIALPGSHVHGILQARVPEWVVFPFSRGSSQPRDGTWVSSITGNLFTIWTTSEVQRLGLKWNNIFCEQGDNLCMSYIKGKWVQSFTFTIFPFFTILRTLEEFHMDYPRRKWQWHPTPVLLPGKSYGRRSLVGCSPWGR